MTSERDVTGPQRPIGIAVVGAGYWGPNLVRNFASSPRYRLTWLCDIDKSRAIQVLGPYSTVGATDDLDVVLADERVDAIAVATARHPSGRSARGNTCWQARSHREAARPQLRRRARMVDAADEQGLVLMCDHTFCYTPAVHRIREIMHSGALGACLSSTRSGSIWAWSSATSMCCGIWLRTICRFWSRAAAGGQAVAVATHAADPVGAGQSCVAFLTLQLPHGALAHIHVNWLTHEGSYYDDRRIQACARVG